MALKQGGSPGMIQWHTILDRALPLDDEGWEVQANFHRLFMEYLNGELGYLSLVTQGSLMAVGVRLSGDYSCEDDGCDCDDDERFALFPAYYHEAVDPNDNGWVIGTCRETWNHGWLTHPTSEERLAKIAERMAHEDPEAYNRMCANPITTKERK